MKVFVKKGDGKNQYLGSAIELRNDGPVFVVIQ